MEIEKFLNYDTLQYCGSDTAASRETLLRLTERHGIHDFFHPFDSKQADCLLDLRRAIRNILIQASVHPHLNRHMSDRKVAEVGGIGHYSGVLSDSEPVHIYDVCGGSGIVAHLISRLRVEHERTTAECIESCQESAAHFEHFRRILALNNPGIRFENHAVRAKPLTPHPGRSTYVLAKHACGNTATDIIEGFVQSLPENATILTCCHGSAHGIPDNAAREGVSREEWRLLAQTADWTTSLVDEKKTVGRVAMRLMDCLRIIGLSSGIQACVREIADPEISIKNQAICLRPGE